MQSVVIAACSYVADFFIILSFEKDRSPVQFVGIRVKYILNAISMFGKVDSSASDLIM